MRIHVRAPATTANIGSGFDCAAAALDAAPAAAAMVDIDHLATLRHMDFHKDRTAAVLGVSRKTLYNRYVRWAGENLM